MSCVNKIRVLHVIGGSLHGGAAKGAINLHRSLLRSGVESFVVCGYADRKVANTFNVVASIFWAQVLERCDNLVLKFFLKRRKIIFSPGLVGARLRDLVNSLDVDILHLHWVNAGFFNISELQKMDLPIVWTVRDAWPFTGGCHIPMSCLEFKKQCSGCEQLGDFQPIDLARLLHRRKSEILRRIRNVTAVGISPFIKNQLVQSSLWRQKRVEVIENSIDFSAFTRFDKQFARSILGLESDKFIVLCGNNSGEIWKGHFFFYRLVEDLAVKNFEMVSFGRGKPYVGCRDYGFIKTTRELSLLYSAVDVFVFPSIYEPFGKAPFEAAFCGSKIVSFSGTGTADFYKKKYEGWWKLLDKRGYEGILGAIYSFAASRSESCAYKDLLDQFCEDRTADKYIELYHEILGA